MIQGMPVTTQPEFAEYEITKTLGIVRGSADGGGFSSLDMVREQSLQRMVERARAAGADGIVAARYGTVVVPEGTWAEVLSYGTAVKLKKKE